MVRDMIDIQSFLLLRRHIIASVSLVGNRRQRATGYSRLLTPPSAMKRSLRAASNAIDYAKFYSLWRVTAIRVCDLACNVIKHARGG